MSLRVAIEEFWMVIEVLLMTEPVVLLLLPIPCGLVGECKFSETEGKQSI